MNNKHATLEVIAPTVEEAIEKGLNNLGLPREKVEVEILDEGSSGLLGLGSRQSRVRIAVKSEEESKKNETKAEEAPPPVEQTKGEEDYTLSLAKDTVTALLQKMNISADVEASYREQDGRLDHPPIMVDITGDDLSILIGRRAQTLNDLQYITRLIMGKELKRGVILTIDVEGYRKRREQQVRQLARRVAEQVVDTQRRQALEPMPANERRFAHIELRDNPNVYTESTGEEPHRKVVVYPRE